MMIIRYRQANKINNIMEQFDNPSETMVELSPSFSHNYIEGTWTTKESGLNKTGRVTELMHINLNNGKVILPKIPNNPFLNGIEYNITYQKGLNLVASSTNSKYIININFINIATNPNYGSDKLIMTTDVPMGIVHFVDNKNNVKYDFMSYKVDKEKRVEGQLKTIIENKNYYSRIVEDKYNVNSYLTIIGHYKFANELIKFNHGIIPNNQSLINAKNIISSTYGNILSFSVAREFETPVGSVIKTRASDMYKLECIKNNMLPNDIIIKPVSKDDNKIDIKMYSPKSTIIYFYKVSNTNETYKFNGNDIKVNQQRMNYENGGNNMFNKNLTMNNIDGLVREIENTYTIITFKTIFTPNSHTDIKIPFKDLINLL